MYLSIYLNAVSFSWLSHLFHIVFLYLTHYEQLATETKLDNGRLFYEEYYIRFHWFYLFD